MGASPQLRSTCAVLFAVRPPAGHRAQGIGRRWRAFGQSRGWLAALSLVAALSLTCCATATADPALAKPHEIVGPAGAVSSLGGLSIARDGTGGLVYLASSGGAQHVYVSRLIGGVFETPVRVDTGLTGASSQPVIAAGNGGLVLVGFINGGDLYVVQAASTSSAWTAPQKLQSGAENPSISISQFSKAYLAYTASAGSGSDVDVEYFDEGVWQPATAPLNVTPDDDAGTGAGRPAVATAGDGIGIVAWGENGHVYARRVMYTSPSVEDEQLDPSSFDGATEESAGTPAISVGGDSSYPDIAYDETLSSGGQTWDRVLMTRLISEDVGSTVAVDGLSSGTPGSAGSPAVAMGEYGTGFVVAGDQSTDQLIGTPLGDNGAPGSPAPVSQGASTSPIVGVPGFAGIYTTFIAWEQSATAGQPQVLLRWGPGGTALEAPMVLSAAGAQVQPADGLAADGDNYGDAAVAWIQGASGSTSLEVNQLYQPPGAANPAKKTSYSRTSQPRLSWSAAADRWGPVTYRVTLGGAVIGQTTGTSLQVPSPLIDGPRVWKVTALNPAGQSTTGRKSTVFVDTVPPHLRISLSGRLRVGRQLSLRVHAVDRPADQTGARASGLASVRISWGEGAVVEASDIKRAHHIYWYAGRIRIRVKATDKAGNSITVSRSVRIRK